MSQLSREQIDYIATEVVSLLKSDGKSVAPLAEAPLSEHPYTGGQFSDIDSAVSAAGQAQRLLMEGTLEKRKRIIASIRKKMLSHAEDLAVRAQQETGLGRKEDKVLKNILVTEKTPGTEFLRPTAQSGDRGLMLIEPAPYGVIGAITPVTNPTSTIICNTIGMLVSLMFILLQKR